MTVLTVERCGKYPALGDVSKTIIILKEKR